MAIRNIKKREIVDAQMINAGQYRQAILEDGSDVYVAYSRDPAAKTTDAVWQVAKVSDSGRLFAGATRAFIHQADDMANLDYSL